MKTVKKSAPSPAERRKQAQKPIGVRFIQNIRKFWMLYLFVLPSLIYLFIFSYIPLYGIQIAFKNYNASDGIWGSPWVGWKYFETFFSSTNFTQILSNTLILSFYQLIAGFPFPIILALILNYIRQKKFQKFVQGVTYAPHFISMVVFCGMISIFLSNNGIVNILLNAIGIDSVNFLGNPQYFRHIYVWSGIMQSMGWSSILYIATLASVSPELHEAAIVDGASKLQRIWHIDLPSLIPTAVILLILESGKIMSVGFEKAFLLQNSINIDYSEIISTYVYKVGIQNVQFSYSSAIGLFNNVINFVLILVVNKLSNKLSGTSLW